MFRKSRTFVIGDIHGAYRALLQCLEKAQFNYKRDRLICLGDICDGWPEVDKCIDKLLQVKRRIILMGNHDEIVLRWQLNSIKSPAWRKGGGNATIDSYPEGIPDAHIDFLSKARSYYIFKKRLFVHAGIQPGVSMKKQNTEKLMWDRSLANEAVEQKRQGCGTPLTKYREIYLGHTPTLRYGKKKPINACDVWLMDTGAAWSGRLSMMNIDTKELFQSSVVRKLYPDYAGRFRF